MQVYNRHQNIPASYLVYTKENKILLLRRYNTGYKDGEYSLVAGHVDDGETFTDALIREAREESGLVITKNQVKVSHMMQRKSDFDGSQRIDVFLTVDYKTLNQDPENIEPHKCDDLSWFDIDNLPENVIPYIKVAINNIVNNNFYSEHGWT